VKTIHGRHARRSDEPHRAFPSGRRREIAALEEAGAVIGYHFAPGGAVVGTAAAFIVAPVAAWWPVRQAARVSPVRALASE